MVYSTCKEYPKLTPPPPPPPPKKKKKKRNDSLYLPVTITCKNLAHYLDALGADIVHIILENRGASAHHLPPSPFPRTSKKEIL